MHSPRSQEKKSAAGWWPQTSTRLAERQQSNSRMTCASYVNAIGHTPWPNYRVLMIVNSKHMQDRLQVNLSKAISNTIEKIHIISKTAMITLRLFQNVWGTKYKLYVWSCFAYPFGPASPSPRTRRVLPLLTPGGIFTLISFLTRTRPSPEHFLQYSEMTSPSPTQVGQIETYKIRKKKSSYVIIANCSK